MEAATALRGPMAIANCNTSDLFLIRVRPLKIANYPFNID